MEKAFVHPYMPNSAPSNMDPMLKELGISSVKEIYEKNIPEALRYYGQMDIPEPISGEYQLKRHVMGILEKTCPVMTRFRFWVKAAITIMFPQYVMRSTPVQSF